MSEILAEIHALATQIADRYGDEWEHHGGCMGDGADAGCPLCRILGLTSGRDYIPIADPKPAVWWEYGVMRPALMPDMSGKQRWTQIVGATYRSREQAENACRRVPALCGVPSVICRRLVSEWEES